MTESSMPGHPGHVISAAAWSAASGAGAAPGLDSPEAHDSADGDGSRVDSGVDPANGPGCRQSFEQVYEEWFDFVWRSVRRLGVHDAAVDDVVQDVFIVVHRKLPTFEGRSSLKTWLFGVARRVVKDHRRSRLRKAPHQALCESTVGACLDSTPVEEVARAEAARLLHDFLERLDDDKREVFVLAELEQMSAPEIAEAVGANLNTIYSRLRAARTSFEEAVARHRARDGWRNGDARRVR